MKKLILALTSMAFAAAVYAGDGSSCQASSGCCSKAKAAEQAKATCPYAAKKMACTKGAPVKQALKSPKAMSLASK